MNISRIIEVANLPVPLPHPQRWDTLESRLGTALPNDFKQIVDSYGLGQWRRWVILFGPSFSPSSYNISTAPFAILEGEREFLSTLTPEERSTDFPYLLWPESGGLFPFATTLQADRLYWVMEGTPDQWPIVLQETRSTETQVFRMSIVDFLRALIDGELDSTLIPNRDYIINQPVFAQL